MVPRFNNEVSLSPLTKPEGVVDAVGFVEGPVRIPAIGIKMTLHIKKQRRDIDRRVQGKVQPILPLFHIRRKSATFVSRTRAVRTSTRIRGSPGLARPANLCYCIGVAAHYLGSKMAALSF